MEVADNNSKLIYMDNFLTSTSTIEVYNVIRNKSVYFVRYYVKMHQLCDYNGIVAEDLWFMDLRHRLSNLYIEHRQNVIQHHVDKLIHISNVLYNIEYCKDIMYVIVNFLKQTIPEAHYMTTI